MEPRDNEIINSSSGKVSRTRFIGTIILVVLLLAIIGGYGWLKFGPENNVRMWLDKETVQRDEPLKLYIRNLGSKSIGFGTPYYIYRINENGTATWVNRGGVWAAVEIHLWSFGTIFPENKHRPRIWRILH